MNNKNLKLAIFGVLIGLFAGFISFLFLKSLDVAIRFRESHEWMILLLPVAGASVAWFYDRFGKDIERGNNLIIDEIHQPQKKIHFKMLPMIFFAATISHFFGASVGREGAAVQMGAAIGEAFSKFFHEHRKIFLMMGMSAGFASIFGAPIAGTIFGMEVITLGFLNLEALFPCTVAGVSGYFIACLLGLHQNPVAVFDVPPMILTGLLSTIIAGILFGLTARLFSFSIHYVKNVFTKNIPHFAMRPFWGGIILALFYYLFRTDRYHNLGEKIIHQAFTERIYPWDFLGKTLMTAISVGSGFRGGEVMPLFYIGSTLGNSLSFFLALPFSLLAGLGFVAVFAGATNTPITGIILAMEFFGADIGIYAIIAVVMSYIFSGGRGIYSSQRGIK